MNPAQFPRYPVTSWRALGYYNLYRFLIAFLFVSLYWIGQLPEPLGIYDVKVFAISAHLLMLVSLAAVFFMQIRIPAFGYQVAGSVILDILIIAAFIYSSAGLNSGFGMLMVIAIAGGGLLIPGRIGFFFASVATLCVLGHEVYLQFSLYRPPPNYIHAGFLGITYFLTAAISHGLARKVAFSEALAVQRAVDLQNLARLNEQIVQRLQSGILVLDEALQVKLCNESARQLLGAGHALLQAEIGSISPELARLVRAWQDDNTARTCILRPEAGSVDVEVVLVRLGLEGRTEILVFMNDVTRLRQQAQQLKLASLGRLTASIAHEVRNPLGAISHAAQLLSESPALNEEDLRLVTIINEQSRRVNTIIENVMQISRRERPETTVINLGDWLAKFISELESRYNLANGDILCEVAGVDIQARMDPEQLYQVMWNICENGMRYSLRKPLLLVHCDRQADTGRPYIDISDSGEGISPKVLERLFEPFVTTENRGTGLGLFLAREMCEANQAALTLHANSPAGCTFRITFVHPDYRQVAV